MIILEGNLKEGLEKHGVPAIKNLRVVRPTDASIVPVNDNLTWAQYAFIRSVCFTVQIRLQ